MVARGTDARARRQGQVPISALPVAGSETLDKPLSFPVPQVLYVKWGGGVLSSRCMRLSRGLHWLLSIKRLNQCPVPVGTLCSLLHSHLDRQASFTGEIFAAAQGDPPALGRVSHLV